ncbi:hypothetical protein GCM10028803_36300 [Larkinella knui]|uniref:GNAT family N-acetyltransferase n=1 Tax=Larkinella knui TaxID=2025310 RepID=A0A3P1CE39_9BACT|nr:GNAT family N-acetyltransferase [Larkinella knui]RRB11490.1 GNAT family N-acetyltransferase [Larkinella knui]
MPIHYEIYDGFPPTAILPGILHLHQRVFSGQTSEELLQEFEDVRNRHLLTLLALDDQAIVGYKMGYQRKPGHFYSWLGCVSPDYRRRGIAGELMNRQHDACKAKGYQTIRTHTRNQWRDMLILNLRHGFDVIGTIAGTNTHTTIILEKSL